MPPLTEIFREKIAIFCGTQSEDIVYDTPSESISIRGEALELSSFFPPKNASLISKFSDIDDYDISPTNKNLVFNKENPSIKYEIVFLKAVNDQVAHGIYPLDNNEGLKSGILFTGLFNSASEPEFNYFPEMIFALCLGISSVNRQNEVSWRLLFESIGPFILCIDEPSCVFGYLSRFGFFKIDSQPAYSFTWENNIDAVMNKRMSDIPLEAEQAYIAALSYSKTADVAFLKLYRVFEILFAVGLKNYIRNLSNRDIIKEIKNIKNNLSEKIMLEKVFLTHTASSFSYFTKALFCDLYPSISIPDQYSNIKKWLNTADANDLFPDSLRFEVIYFIRCSLVHSKLGDEECLLEPFEQNQYVALKSLVEDMQGMIRSILY